MMQAIHEFFHMGGYAFYVWFSYGLVLLVLGLNLWLPIRRRQQIRQQIYRQQQRMRQKNGSSA